jgi:hypothetical protein
MKRRLPENKPASKAEAFEPKHHGKLILNDTACHQDISYPTDLNLLNHSTEKSEELTDFLYQPDMHIKKPRTYREVARKKYLTKAQKKVKSKREIRSAVKKQLEYLNRNIKSLRKLLLPTIVFLLIMFNTSIFCSYKTNTSNNGKCIGERATQLSIL